MKYVGSKNKISQYLAPIIQSYITEETQGYLEPFVGGANMIDKIKCQKKIGCDIHEELIELLKYVQNLDNKLPKGILKEEYDTVRANKGAYSKWYVGLVGFCASYNAKYFGGYAGDVITKRGVRHYDQEAIRNLEKQRLSLQNISFKYLNFLALPMDRIKGYVIYCDIPYADVTGYNSNSFEYTQFYHWVEIASQQNIVLVSEYNMPQQFECIWSHKHYSTLNKNNNRICKIEKLFKIKEEIKYV